MKIAICDDEKVIVDKIKKAIIKGKTEYNSYIDIKEYSLGTSLLEAIQKGEQYELIFLDIEMDTLDGLEVGQQIRKVMDDYNTQIAIVSGQHHYAMKAYEIMPIKFIPKPFQDKEIVEAVKLAQKVTGNKTRFFTYKINRDIFKIPTDDIYYFEIHKKEITIANKGKEIKFYSTLKELETQLKDYGFVRTKRYLIVNGKYITFVQGNELTLSNGKVLEIGKEYKADLLKYLED